MSFSQYENSLISENLKYISDVYGDSVSFEISESEFLSLFEAEDSLSNYWNGQIGVGNAGKYVKVIQKVIGTKDDGIFGNGTKAKLKEWQKANGLADDGIFGIKTLEKMFGSADNTGKAIFIELLGGPDTNELKGSPGKVSSTKSRVQSTIESTLTKIKGDASPAVVRAAEAAIAKNSNRPAGNTVTGGIFDLNDQKTYDVIKGAKTWVINGVNYTALLIADNAKALADAAKKAATAGADTLVNVAKFAGKAIIFTGSLAYVVAKEVLTGIMGLLGTALGYAKSGAIKIGQNVASALTNANNWLKEKKAQAWNSISNAGESLMKGIMTGLFAVASATSKAAEALSALIVSSYKLAQSSFKSIANFATACVYNAYKSVKNTAIALGSKATDLYNNAVKTYEQYKTSIANAVKSGMSKLQTMAASSAQSAMNYASRLASDAKAAYQSAQSAIVKTGEEIASQASAIWNAIWDSEEMDYVDPMFESYIMLEGEKYYVPTWEYAQIKESLLR